MKLLLSFLILTGISVSQAYSQNPTYNTNADSSKTETPYKTDDFDSWNTRVKISADEFNKGAVFSPLQLIQGKVPGFNINCINVNDPNPDIQTQLRGASSVWSGNNPLYIVNGVVLDDASFIPVESIESIDVLKNISETSLYGVRGTDGVIIIHTKKNLPGTFNVSYSTYGYVEKLGKSEYMNANDWRQLNNTWGSSSYSELQSHAMNARDYNANTDWLKEISQQKLSQSHFLNFSGTYNKTSYVANVGYDNYNGIIQKIDNRKLSGQLYISQLAFKDKLEASVYVIGTDRKYSAIDKNVFINSPSYSVGSNYTNIINIANQYNPTVPTDRIDTYYSYNPLELLNLPTDNRTQNNFLSNVALSYKLTSNLKISASYSIHKRTDKNTFSEHNDSLRYGVYNELKEKTINVNLAYNKSIHNHHFNFLVNYSNQSNTMELKNGDLDARLDVDTIIFSNPHPEYQIFGDITSFFSNNYKIINTCTSIKYDYKNKYFLSAGLSQEKSPFYRYQISTEGFLSLRAGWAIKKEIFLEKVNWINELTILAGYGASKKQVNFDYIPKTFLNPDIHGEKLDEYNIEIDGSLFSRRLGFSIDYYNLNTNEGIDVKVVRVSSNYSQVLVNNAKIKNTGWEFNVTGKPIVRPFLWTIYGNISRNNNTVLSDTYLSGYNMKDLSVGTMMGYKFAGFSNTNSVLVYDNNGNKVSYNSVPASVIGNGVPKSFWGLVNNFEYKQFELSISIRGALGFNIRNSENFSFNENRIFLMDRNFKNNIYAIDQRALLSQNDYGIENSDYIIEKGNYAKIDNINLSYTLTPQKNVFKSLKFYVGCNNVALITKFSGSDPEMASIYGSNPGSYYYENYPFTRIYVFGLKCSL